MVDTVQLSESARGSVSSVAGFDPTRGAGSLEQRHVGGALATTSAKDGFNGWAAMLHWHFGLDDGVDHTEMPFIEKFNWNNVGRFSSAEGYHPSSCLTAEERNLMANLYVYAHDHGIDVRGGSGFSALAFGGMVGYAACGHKMNDFISGYASDPDFGSQRIKPETFKFLQGLSLDQSEGLHSQDPLIRAAHNIANGVIDERPRFAGDDEATRRVLQIATEVLSSSAMKDNLLDTSHLDNVFLHILKGFSSGEAMVSKAEDVRRLVYAYSRSGSRGEVTVSDQPSAQAQKLLDYRQKWVDLWDRAELMARDIEPVVGSPAYKAGVRFGAVPGSVSDSGKGSVPGLGEDFGLGSVSKQDGLELFAKYSSRVARVVTSLSEDQKSTLGMMYRLAERKGSEAALLKVDQLAGAMASLNFMNEMLGADKSKNPYASTNFWTQLLQQNQHNQMEALRTALETHLNKTTAQSEPKSPEV
ncbi:hypothetical protein [Mobiluncus sp.]|uniref:hypothetical protein n=1 Tax=Mobiluncus sp. TaxID=47293 RepID=UPI002A91EF3E|nr:hypothetical protein [Mobiluncus sp.]MDY6076862.1 hypothetical protein [Mobiluncus sp.]